MHLGDRFGDLFQLSYITRDMDQAIEHCRTALGIESFHRSQSTTEVLSGGRVQSLTVKAAMANIGNHQLEIIEPVSGPVEVYTDAVDLSGHLLNFHHIAIAVRGGRAGWDKLQSELHDSGDEIAFLFPAAPSPDDKVRFCYVDTRARIGHYTEYLWWDEALTGLPSFPALGR